MSKKPDSDVWRLFDDDEYSQNYQKPFVFDFTKITVRDLKSTSKEYIWINYLYGRRRLKGLKEFLRRIVIADAFMSTYGCCLKSMDYNAAEAYRSFLSVYISPSTGKRISYTYQRNCFSELKSLVLWCQHYLPDRISPKMIFTGNEYRDNNKISIKYIPDRIMHQINQALSKEDNPYLVAGIIILKNTGMRVGDLLLLDRQCIESHPINGEMLCWYDHKNQKRHKPIPINQECKTALDALFALSEEYRYDARKEDSDKLFLYRPVLGNNTNPVVPVSRIVFMKWCRGFSKKHNIRDDGGNLFPITSHMFRRTLGTDMFSKGTNLKVIQDVLGHSSPETTKKYYSDVKEDSYAEMFNKIGILGNITDAYNDKRLSDESRSYIRKYAATKARLADGYCTMPIHDGQPCGRIMSKWKCFHCRRYITTVEDLEEHKKTLKELEESLENNVYGEHYAAHLKPSIVALKEIITQLEAIQSEQ